MIKTNFEDQDTKLFYDELIEFMDSNITILSDKEEENSQNTLMALWHKAAGNSYSAIEAVKHELPILDDNQKKNLTQLIQRRISGVPLAYLTERQSFDSVEKRRPIKK